MLVNIIVMDLSIISALTTNYVIGKLNTIPWFLPYDMVWFKYHTLNRIVIMGRKTFESINSNPLSNRLNIVLSRKNIVKRFNICNLFFVQTPEEALWTVKRISNNVSEVMIIGGEQIYRIFLPHVIRLYLTCINMVIQGDTFFPRYKQDEWNIIYNKEHDDGFYCSYCFKIFERS